MREIRFQATYQGREYNVQTIQPSRNTRGWKGWHKNQGYILRRVSEHPFASKRGYVREHRLVVEEHLGAFLLPNQFIHHINQNRTDNRLENLVIQGNISHATEHLTGKRNLHGQFVAIEPIFTEIKLRLLNTNTNQMRVYTLQELIATTYRRGQFRFRGRFTGLHDKNGKEIYEGDIIKFEKYRKSKIILRASPSFGSVTWGLVGFEIEPISYGEVTYAKGVILSNEYTNMIDFYDMEGATFAWEELEVIGNIYENPELLEAK